MFWSLLGTFIWLLIVMQVLMQQPLRESINNILGINFVPMLFLFSGTIFFLLGLSLLILAVKAELDKTLKIYLIVTSASAVGIFASMVLHNLVYGLFIHFWGEDFWQRTGMEDEPLFFIMAIFVCPIAYLVGTIGSIVLFFRRRSSLPATK